MAEVKVSALPAVTTLADADLVPVVVSGVTSKITKANFEGMLNTRQTFSNAAVTILATTRVLAQTGTMSAARIATLPAANALPAGTAITVCDQSGTITATNTISVARAGSDTINGAAASIAISGPYGAVIFITDGTSNWEACRLVPTSIEIYKSGNNTVILHSVDSGSITTRNAASFTDVVETWVEGSTQRMALRGGRLQLTSTGVFGFTSSSNDAENGTDLYIQRNAAGQAKITGDGTALAGVMAGATTTVPGAQFNAPPSGTQNIATFGNNAGTEISAINSSGGFVPVSMADGSAANSTIYYSTTARKLVYKDAGGVVNNLYPGVPSFDPASLGFVVFADAATGLYDAASGGSAVTTDGATVQSWTNTGTAGGRLAKLSNVNGPKYRPNSGKPYLEFGAFPGNVGYALGIDLPPAPSGDMTVYSVVSYPTPATETTQTAVWTMKGRSWGDSGKLALDIGSKDYGIATGYDTADSSNTASLSRPLPTSDGGWAVVACRRVAGSPSTWSIFLNGYLLYSGTTTITEAGLDRSNVGGPMYGGGGFAGGIAAYAHARAAHTDAEIMAMTNWLYANVPVMAAPAKLVAWLGDSTGTPMRAVESMATESAWKPRRGTVYQTSTYLMANSGLSGTLNYSVGGYTAQQIREKFAVAAAGALSRATSKRVAVVQCGTNDIRVGGGGLTPAQAYAKVLELIAAVRAATTGRVEVVICTICDGNPNVYPGFTADRNTFNGLIVSGAAAGDYTVARVDLDDIGLDWGSPARLDSYFYGDPMDANRDGLHRIAPGMDREAIVIRAAIASVL